MRYPHILLLLTFLVFNFSLSAQCLVQSSSLEDRLSEGDLVVEGKVMSQFSFFGKEERLIYTAHQIEVYKVFKGNIERSSVEIVTTGGVVGDRMLEVNPSLKLTIGQTGLFLFKAYRGNNIDDSRTVIWRPVADAASFLPYDPKIERVKDVFETETMTRQKLYRRIEQKVGHNYQELQALPQSSQQRLVPAITSFTPTTATAGTETLITITGTDFGSTTGTVFFDAADDGAGGSFTGAAAFHIQSWTTTEIQVWVPTGSGTGNIFVRDAALVSGALSTQTLTVTYNITNTSSGGSSFRTFLIDDGCDSDGGYKFLYSNNTANSGVDFTAESSGAAQDAFERAVASWHTSVGFAIFASDLCGTTSIQMPGNDGTNIVGFDNSVWDLDTEASSSTLAVCYSQFSRCSGGSVSEWEVVGLDVVFRRDGDPNGTGGSVTWEYGPATPSGGESDFESVALHELGHGHQLGHVIDNGAVMHFSITTGTSNRSLGADDITAANDVETVSLAYSPIVFGVGCGGDFSCSRAYAIYNSGNECALVPVDLIAFDGVLVKDAVELSWATASETNNDFFTLERSSDGARFEIIATIQGAGNSLITQNYQYLDQAPQLGLNYYRLSQTDFDGTQKHSEVIAIRYAKATKTQIQPNPFSGETFQLIYETPQEGLLTIGIYTLTGKLLRREQVMLEAGASVLDFTMPDLSTGMYLVEMSMGKQVEVLKLVKR